MDMQSSKSLRQTGGCKKPWPLRTLPFLALAAAILLVHLEQSSGLAGNFAMTGSLNTLGGVVSKGTTLSWTGEITSEGTGLSGGQRFGMKAGSIVVTSPSLDRPSLLLEGTSTKLRLSWGAGQAHWILMESTSVAGASWTMVDAQRQIQGERVSIMIEVTNSERFFKLISP
jgi:hypothetical protein